MNKYSYFLILIFMLTGISSWKVSDRASKDLRDKLERLKEVFISTAIGDKIDERMKYYTPNAISMPDYQPLMEGVDLIRKYYTEIFKRQQVRKYTKEITEVIDMGGSVAEYGTFKIEFTAVTGGTEVHTGKYCNIWAVQSDGTLLIEAEGWGYFHQLENSDPLYVASAVMERETGSMQLDEKGADIFFELKAMNALWEKLVKKRSGIEQADFYAVDGIYMPFADTAKTGREMIRKHLINYTSGSGIVLDSVDVHTYNFNHLGDYVIEYSKFYVKWTTADRTGKTKGKGIRLLKRTPAGSLKMYRQIGFHDSIFD